ncbi:unnamed protein product [Leptosia nina]|uniref:Uncharacterized protein n=1 Tax=Leptosia nina TaxID=320188 RepID=A0AAV1K449_9NEOP
MIVLSNIFRGNHPQNQVSPEITAVPGKANCVRPVAQSSLRFKKRTTVGENLDNSLIDGLKKVKSEKCISNSVDTFLTHREGKEKVICSAKGLLETNLDDIFSDVQRDGWSQAKSLGASESIIRLSDAASKRESIVDSEEDTVSSECGDSEAREQRKCMGARRFGHLLRRVISRNVTSVNNARRGSTPCSFSYDRIVDTGVRATRNELRRSTFARLTAPATSFWANLQLVQHLPEF